MPFSDQLSRETAQPYFRRLRIILCALGLTGVFSISAFGVDAPAVSKISPELLTRFQSGNPGATAKVWVFFTDKGIADPAVLAKATADLSEYFSFRAIARRQKVRPGQLLFDETDLPVSADYLSLLSNSGITIHEVSRWLNAASISMTYAQALTVANLAFVREILPVMRTVQRLPAIEPVPRIEFAPAAPGALNYGPSFRQVSQIRANILHRLGYTGKGVLIGMLDTGFFIDHPVFDSLRLQGRIVATRDFINGDADVQDNAFDGQRDHGTATFSLLGGFADGTLIGTAFGASFALAKTEIVATEYIISEEDRWVKGLEWLDSLGADIVSSSLGYNVGDTGFSYTPAQMDGNTATTTKAADLAASKGLLVVNAAGNEGNDPWRIIIAPADGDSVLAVGAVDSLGFHTSFSSTGPTADGRIKPDVMAQGEDDWLASASGGYGRGGGTSFATPLAAGVAALLLEIDSTLTPFQIIQRLHQSASQASRPDNLYGWGIVNAARAAGFPEQPPVHRAQIRPNPVRTTATIDVTLDQPGKVELSIHTLAGERLWELVTNAAGTGAQTYFWDGRNQLGQPVAGGLYLLLIKTTSFQDVVKFALTRP